MPDLGRYAVAVLSSWGVSLALLAGLVGWTLWQGARVRDALARAEARAGLGKGGGAGRDAGPRVGAATGDGTVQRGENA